MTVSKSATLAEYLDSFHKLGLQLRFPHENGGNSKVEDLLVNATPATRYIAESSMTREKEKSRWLQGDSLIRTVAIMRESAATIEVIAQNLFSIFQRAAHTRPDHAGFEDDFVIVSPHLNLNTHIWLIFKNNAADNQPLVAYDTFMEPQPLSKMLAYIDSDQWPEEGADLTPETVQYRKAVKAFLAPFRA